MRLRVLLLIYTPIVAYNSAIFVLRLVEGRMVFALISGSCAFFSLVVAGIQARYMLKPRVRKLDRKAVRGLEDQDLDLLEAVIASYNPERKRLYTSELDQLHDSWEDYRGGSLKPEAEASFARLVACGLLEDARFNRRERFPSYRPSEKAQAILESERERREHVAPLGPRSRPNALSA